MTNHACVYNRRGRRKYSKADEVLCYFEGDLTSVEELHHFTDESLIRKTYKIKDTSLSVASLLDLLPVL